MKVTLRVMLLMLLLVASSCGSKKKIAAQKEAERKERTVRVTSKEETSEEKVTRTTAPKTYTDKVTAYISLYAPIAQEEMHLYKIPASITLAQGILESGAGEGRLTREANNHFGIKCHDWTGAKIYHDDDLRQECFRKYKDPKYSFRDHSLFLAERSRYAGLFELDPTDYVSWAKGLRAAGYATDRKYPEKLISIIERYELYKYDGEVLGKDAVAYTEKQVPQRQYIVKQGDTLYSISKRFGLTVEQLQQYNKLKGTALAIGQVLVINP
ncbi:glucosaminidase domain-containing protein [Salinimicrobium soli]|uniref:glucosaminidase domain-containing protein n=1 Tax=Salinimicrobium soli TaxID=1254399 RepID=UPI003AADE181